MNSDEIKKMYYDILFENNIIMKWLRSIDLKDYAELNNNYQLAFNDKFWAEIREKFEHQ